MSHPEAENTKNLLPQTKMALAQFESKSASILKEYQGIIMVKSAEYILPLEESILMLNPFAGRSQAEQRSCSP
jgi:hypothetical protein